MKALIRLSRLAKLVQLICLFHLDPNFLLLACLGPLGWRPNSLLHLILLSHRLLLLRSVVSRIVDAVDAIEQSEESVDRFFSLLRNIAVVYLRMSANICVSGNFLFGLFFSSLLNLPLLVVGILNALLSGTN